LNVKITVIFDLKAYHLDLGGAASITDLFSPSYTVLYPSSLEGASSAYPEPTASFLKSFPS
jgi:hypothetical protein